MQLVSQCFSSSSLGTTSGHCKTTRCFGAIRGSYTMHHDTRGKQYPSPRFAVSVSAHSLRTKPLLAPSLSATRAGSIVQHPSTRLHPPQKTSFAGRCPLVPWSRCLVVRFPAVRNTDIPRRRCSPLNPGVVAAASEVVAARVAAVAKGTRTPRAGANVAAARAAAAAKGTKTQARMTSTRAKGTKISILLASR